MKKQILLFLLIFSCTNLVRAKDDTLDPSFNAALAGSAPLQAGVLIDNIHPDTTSNSFNLKELYLQSGDRIVVGGRCRVSGVDQLALTRFNTDGTRDTSFGTNGATATFFGSGTIMFGETVALQKSNEKILMGGRISPVVLGAIPVARYDANGILDPTFNPSGTPPGTVVGIFGSDQNIILAMDVDAAGKVLVTGRAEAGSSDLLVARYNSDGSIDNSFGTNGFIAIRPVDPSASHNGSAIKVLSDGKILVGGSATIGGLSLGLLIRLTNTGALDTTFGGGDGWVTEDFGFPANHSNILRIVTQGDGSIIVLGLGDLKASIAKFTSTGVTDSTFTKTVIDGTSFFRDGAVQADGKIFAVGRSAGPNESLIVRFNANGTLDNTFGTAGVLILNLDGVAGSEEIRSMAIQDDGNLVFLGDTDSGEFVLGRLLVSSISSTIAPVTRTIRSKFRFSGF